MTKIVILGSCKYAPYEILITPEKRSKWYNTDKGYNLASLEFYPKILECDEVWCYAPKGIGHHTMRDLNFAKRCCKIIRIIGEY